MSKTLKRAASSSEKSLQYPLKLIAYSFNSVNLTHLKKFMWKKLNVLRNFTSNADAWMILIKVMIKMMYSLYVL